MKLEQLNIRLPKTTNKIMYWSTTFIGLWVNRTYDKDGNEIRYETFDGVWEKRTYDENGYQLTYENSDGEWSRRTYDKDGNILTFKSGNKKDKK